jgi:prolyl-tRNA synthetase
MKMRIHDLKIETLRQAPSNARTEGFACLVRASYLTRDNKLTQLGEQTVSRWINIAITGKDLFVQLGLGVIKTEDQETFFEISSGDTEILQCPACHYADRVDTARSRKQPFPAETLLPVEKVSTPDCNTIESLANFLGIPREKTAKALMYTRCSDRRFIFIVVRGDMQLSEIKLKKLVGDIRLATSEEIERSGAVAGYASPMGLKDALIIVDDLIPGSVNLAAGANEPGCHLKNTNYGRDYRADIIADVTKAGVGNACPNCGMPLDHADTELLADEHSFYYENILVALAETCHDDKGLILPILAAPFAVYLMQLPGKEIDTKAKAEELYMDLQNADISVLFDDRAERAGVKFNDADLIGLPLRVTIGEKTMKEGMVELKLRKDTQNLLIPTDEINQTIRSLLETIK